MTYDNRKMPWGLKGTASSGQKFIWNMVGSMSNALSSFLLLAIVTRINGSADGGIFSLAFSTAQFLTTIGCFETRAIQATDVKGRVAFKDYFSFRVMTCVLMMAGAFVYVVWTGQNGMKAAVILLICFYKALDCLSDSFQGLFQLEDRIDLSGMSLGIRVIFSTLFFAGALLFTKSLLTASMIMCIVSIVIILLFDKQISAHYALFGFRFNLSAVKRLFWECLPLFIGSFMAGYIISAPKYAIDRYLTDEIQNYFGFLLMPAFVINLFSLFVFRPMLTTLAVYWEDDKKKEFFGVIKKSTAWILFLTVGGVAGAYLLGIPILNVFSGLDLHLYRLDLVLIMLGGSMNAFITVFYYVLTVMRKQALVLVGYGIGFLSAWILAPLLVKRFAIHGASISYGLPMMLTAVFFAAAIGIVTNKRKNITNEEL